MFFLWVRKFAVWNNIVKNRTLNLCMEQEGKLFFHFSTGGPGVGEVLWEQKRN